MASDLRLLAAAILTIALSGVVMAQTFSGLRGSNSTQPGSGTPSPDPRAKHVGSRATKLS